MDASDLRTQNLRALVKKHGQTALAKLADTSPVYLSQVMTGQADRYGNPRQLGPKVARKIELALELPRGWMDQPHPVDTGAAADGPSLHAHHERIKAEGRDWIRSPGAAGSAPVPGAAAQLLPVLEILHARLPAAAWEGLATFLKAASKL